jgi:glycosyltransferase involved in cell wall biosynthesis
MTPLITIIIPIYKVEKYLKKCVFSVLSQSYTNLEIFLVDDGSPDNCGKMCDEFAQKDSRIKVIHKENGGLSDARNVAIEVATGEWITFIDSDDYVSSDYVKTLYDLVSKYKCQLGVSGYKTFNEGDQPSLKLDKPTQQICLSSMAATQMMFYQEKIDNMAWAKIYHRSLFPTGIRYPYGLIYEDLPTTYQLFLKAEKIAITNHETYFYLIRKESLEGQKFNKKKLDSGIEILHKMRTDKNLSGILEKPARCRLFSFCLHLLMEMPDDYADNRKYELINYVKANRIKILLDLKSRRKAKIAALLSFGGRTLMKKALSVVKKRSKIS